MRQTQSQIRKSFAGSLLQTGRLWRRVADDVVRKYGVSEATALPLLLLGRSDTELRQNALADAMGIEGPTLVRLLDQLCAGGYIERRGDPADRRAKLLTLTPSGRALALKIEDELETLRDAAFATVSDADLQACLRVFTTLREAFARDGGLRPPAAAQTMENAL